MKSEFLLVAKQLMETERRPMSARELIDIGQRQQLFSDKISGATPAQTMKAKLSVHIRKMGPKSVFVRTRPGTFYLRALLSAANQSFEAPPLRPPTSEERVLVYSMTELDRLMTWQGISTRWQSTLAKISGRLRPKFLYRFDVETDNHFTQLVTYILVTNGESLLAYKRGTYSRVDKFLKGAYCVGFGGHVVDTDIDLFSADTMGVYRCAARELKEELQLPNRDQERLESGVGLEILGLLNDDSSDVGRRHLAVVMRYTMDSSSQWKVPMRGEKAITQLQWLSPTPVDQVLMWNFEYWSQLCLAKFFPRLTSTRASYRVIRKRALQPPNLVCVIGPVGSGKTFATRILQESFGYREINSGRVVANLIGLPPVPSTSRDVFQQKAMSFIAQPDGPELLARSIMALVEADGSERILIDGIRQRETLNQLRQHSSGLRVGVIFVQTPVNVAFDFYRSREAEGSSFADFLVSRNAPVEAEVDQLIDQADAIIYNWTGRMNYRKTINGLMRELGVGGKLGE